MNVSQTSIAADNRPVPATASAAPTWWRLHAPGIVVVLLLAAVLVGPRWFFLTTDPPEGVRVQVNLYGSRGIGVDEGLYLALIRDAYDGELPVRDPFLEDDSDSAPQASSLWNVVVGTLGRPLGGDERALAVVTTVAAVVAFALFYVLALRLTGSRWAAIATVAIGLMAVYVLERSPGFLALRHWETLQPLLTLDPQHELHIWTRYVAPAMPLPIYFGAVLLVPDGILKGRRWHLAGAGLLLGLLIYTYVFYWMSFVLALGGWALWLALSGDRKAAARIAVLIGIGFLVASPELALLVRNGLTLDDDVQGRVGAFGDLSVNTTWIRAVGQRLVLGVPLIYLALRGPRINAFYVTLYLAPLLPAATKDLLPQTDHFIFHTWTAFAIPLAIVASVEAFWLLPANLRPAASAAIAVLAIVGVVQYTTIQVRAVREINETFAMDPDEYAAFSWIEHNLSESDTVVTPSWITNQQLAVLTPASTYLADGFYTRISNEEIADRYLRVSAAYGIPEDTVFYRVDPARDAPGSERNVPDDGLERSYDEAAVYYLFNETIRRPKRITDHFPEWRQTYGTYTGSSNILGEYEADYLFCGHRERFWDVDRLAPGTWVEEAFRQGEAVVFRLVDRTTPGAVEFDGCRSAAGN